jgi:hypothetical protein
MDERLRRRRCFRIGPLPLLARLREDGFATETPRHRGREPLGKKDTQSGRRDTPPRVFCKKRLQAAENKGSEREKESQEKQRGGKLLKRRSLAKRQRNSVVE